MQIILSLAKELGVEKATRRHTFNNDEIDW
jgi:hypothetical protein